MTLNESHHAQLFAWIVKSVVEEVGVEQGEPVIRKAVRKYGEERGKRMALRATENGHALNMATYLAYSEWEASGGNMQVSMKTKVPHATVEVHKCPWHTTWEQDGLIEFGRYYCLEIDEAVVRGFNPDLKIDINGTRTNGADCCEFVFREAKLHLINLIKLAYRKKIFPAQTALMPWDYHLGHLFTTMESVIKNELGEPGTNSIAKALEQFEKEVGSSALEILKGFRATDFSSLP